MYRDVQLSLAKIPHSVNDSLRFRSRIGTCYLFFCRETDILTGRYAYMTNGSLSDVFAAKREKKRTTERENVKILSLFFIVVVVCMLFSIGGFVRSGFFYDEIHFRFIY